MDALLFRGEPEVLGEIGVLLLDEAQVRDVLGCADDRHDDAVGVHHRLVPHPDPHRCPVPAEHREVALPGAAGVHLGEDRGGTVLLGGGHQHVSDGLAQHLVSGPPVQLLGLLVPQEDRASGSVTMIAHGRASITARRSSAASFCTGTSLTWDSRWTWCCG